MGERPGVEQSIPVEDLTFACRTVLGADSDASALFALARLAVLGMPGASAAAFGFHDGVTVRTRGATADFPADLHRLQESTGGPDVEEGLPAAVVVIDDLTLDPRWPQFARRARQEHGIRALLSIRLDGVAKGETVSLTIVAGRPGAFDVAAVRCAEVLLPFAGLAVATVAAREEAAQLKRGLETSREIGVAIGEVMATHKVTRNQAFGLLRAASQNVNRKVRDVAVDVADTGLLPLSAEAIADVRNRG
jgi:hypothetical protein